MKHKHSGHTGHKHEIGKAMGHLADPAPKANKDVDSGIYVPSVKGDKMAHGTHHAANAHHNMSEGMGPHGEHGTIHPKASHLGQNETHEDDYSEKGMGEGTMGADHEESNEHDD
jgi:hypothetical protein